MDANYLNLKAKKKSLSVKHNKLFLNYKNMEQILLKQQKELEELKVENENAYQANNEV
jgi:hypothetical protein